MEQRTGQHRYPTGRGYDGSIGEDTPLIANDAEISVIAAHIAAYAIDALIGSEVSIYLCPGILHRPKAWVAIRRTV